MCKSGTPNTYKLKIKQIYGIILRLWRSATCMHIIQLCFVLCNNQFSIFSGKTVTYIAYIFICNGKSLFKIIFWHFFFHLLTNFQIIFFALLKTFRMQNGGMVIFFLRSFRKVEF